MRQRSDQSSQADNARSPFATRHLQGNLTRRSVRGVAVTMSAQVIKVAAQFATVAILARLLSPADFGIFAIIMALLGLLEIFKDLGLSSATVQRAEITETQVSTLFWLNAGLGIAAAGGLAAAAPLLGMIYGEPILTQLTPVVALTLVMTGLAAQHLALLRRQMRFTALAVLQTTAELVAMATSSAVVCSTASAVNRI